MSLFFYFSLFLLGAPKGPLWGPPRVGGPCILYRVYSPVNGPVCHQSKLEQLTLSELNLKRKQKIVRNIDI